MLDVPSPQPKAQLQDTRETRAVFGCDVEFVYKEGRVVRFVEGCGVVEGDGWGAGL
jgi:hypothetical protein